MNKAYLILFLALGLNVKGQDCIDESLIDPETMCPFIYAPVCGCNGITYDNDCIAQHLGGVTSWTDGACAEQVICNDLSGIDFGMCDMFLGYAWNGSTCVPMSGCGYVVDEVDYSADFYENGSDCMNQCGDVLHDCINFWQIEQGYLVDCAAIFAPVCGCDGITYNNTCEAFFLGGVTTYSIGTCEDTLCLVIPSMIDFGECEMPLGWALTETGCIEMSGCDYIGQNGYDYSELFFESSYECGSQCIGSVIIGCIDPTLIDESIMCTAEYDPVCGCDNVTYSNDCVATFYGGVTSYTPGECLSMNIDPVRLENVLIYPNPANDILNLVYDHIQKGMIRIRDISGKVVYERNFSGQRIVADIGHLTRGLYILEVSEEHHSVIHHQIMKE